MLKTNEEFFYMYMSKSVTMFKIIFHDFILIGRSLELKCVVIYN